MFLQFLHCWLIYVVKGMSAGGRGLVLSGQNLDPDCVSSDWQVNLETMDTKALSPEVNRTLYPEIEPYNTGFLRVSDIHTIYYEESGNPDGHVSFHNFSVCFMLI